MSIEDSSRVTPFNVQKHIPDAILNDYSYKQMIAFSSLQLVNNTLINIQKQKLTPRDIEVREVIFNKRFSFEEQPDLFDFMENHFKPIKTVDYGQHLKFNREKCQIKKHEFWRKYLKQTPSTKERVETRNIISQVKQEQTLIFQAVFLTFAATVAYFLKLKNNPIKFTILFTGVCLGWGYLFSIYRSSNSIFNNLPELPQKEAELERRKIINFCYSLDVELDNIKKRLEDFK